jgi:hypothetical protein
MSPKRDLPDDNLADLIRQGAHWLVCKHPDSVTVQALTDAGYSAISDILKDLGVPKGRIAAIGRKRRGYYYASVNLPTAGNALLFELATAELLALLTKKPRLDGVVWHIDTPVDDLALPSFTIVPGDKGE